MSIPAPGERRFRVVGFWRRAVAALCDGLLVVPFMALFAVVVTTLGGRPLHSLGELGPAYVVDLAIDGGGIGVAALAMAGLVGKLYFFLFHALRGQSPGQRLLRMRIIDAYGEPPAPGRVLLRTACSLVSLAGFGLGCLWIGFDREKRALHDWLAGTYVVGVAAPAPAARPSVVEGARAGGAASEGTM